MLIPSWSFSFRISKEFVSITPHFHRELSCGLLQRRLILSCGWPDFRGTEYELQLILSSGQLEFGQLDTCCGCLQSRRLAAGYDRVEFRQMDTSCGCSLLKFLQLDTGCGRLRPTLTWVPAAGYELQPTTSYDWLEFWIRLQADFILRLTTSYSWFYSVADSSPPAGLDLRLTYTLIYQVNLRTYSAKYIIFMVFFPPLDFSYYWSWLWLLLQAPQRSLRKLEEPWRSCRTLAATDSSCSSWFELRRLIRDLRPIDYFQNFDPDAPW